MFSRVDSSNNSWSISNFMDLHALLIAAINSKQLIRFSYDGLERIIEPHDYGIHKGLEKLLAYQLGGQSRSGKIPEWRWFNISGITGGELLQQYFAGNRPAPSGVHHQWDKIYARVSEPEQPSKLISGKKRSA